MGRLTEPLSGGLNTAKDPALLEPGQLSDGRNALYLPGDPRLTKARGRQAFGTVTAATGVVGLRDALFDNADHLVLAHASASYLTAVVSAGTFGLLASGVGQGTQLEVVQYRNRFFLFNGASTPATGAGSNTVVYLSATAAAQVPRLRLHGLLPVESAPNVTTAGGGVFSQSVTGFYEYWTTEVAKLTQDGSEVVLESTFNSVNGTTTQLISATSVVPTIQMPALRNPNTTHWRVYRSTMKATAIEKLFPTGFMIGEAATATASIPDTSTASNTGFKFPTTYNSGADFYKAATNPSNLGADDASVATFSHAGSLPVPTSQGAYGFAFGGFSGVINGIEVVIEGFGTVGTPVNATIGVRDAVTSNFKVSESTGLPRSATKSGIITSTSAGAPTVLTLGGPADTWLTIDQPPFGESDFSSAFMVVLSISKPSTTVSLDYVKIKVYYGGSSDSTIQFPTVVYTFGDVVSQVGKNGPPPSSSTADVYQDCLVCNDVSNPSMVRYSFPGEPESFPGTYYLDFETRENDQVRLVKVVNSRLMVGLDGSMHRINYLPSERDASFDRGMASEPVSRSYGVVNPMCACTYSPEGGSERLAFVSDQGICDTDAYDFRFLTSGLDWRGIISLASTSTPIALINDRELQTLKFYYRNDAITTETYLCLPLSYAAEHLVNGKPKVGLPIHMRNSDGAGNFASLESAWPVPRVNGDITMLLGYGGTNASAGAGKVFVESTAASFPAADTTMRYTTRRLYLAGLGNEWMIGDLYGYAGSYTGAPVVTYSVEGTKTNDSGPTQRGAKSITLAGQKLHKVSPRMMVEGARVTAQITASAYAADLLIIDGNGFGLEDSGR